MIAPGAGSISLRTGSAIGVDGGYDREQHPQPVLFLTGKLQHDDIQGDYRRQFQLWRGDMELTKHFSTP